MANDKEAKILIEKNGIEFSTFRHQSNITKDTFDVSVFVLCHYDGMITAERKTKHWTGYRSPFWYSVVALFYLYTLSSLEF